MKILFIEPCNVEFGGYFRAFNICSALSKNKIKVHLLCTSKEKFFFGIRVTKFNNNFTRFELPRFYFHFFINGRILRGLIGILFGLFGRYDIIHAFVPTQLESNIPAVFFKLLGKKVVMDWDDYWEGSSIYREYKLMKKYVKFCEVNAPRFFGNIVVVSSFLENLAKKRGAKRVLKLINAINNDQFILKTRSEARKKLNLEEKEKYLLSFGNTYINDRAYLLFKTFDYIYRRDSSIKLLFNYNPYNLVKNQKLEKKVSLDCFKNIINVEYIKQKDLGYYIGACDATIFLMGDTDNERACFPIRVGSYLNGNSIVIMNDNDSEVVNTLKKFGCAIFEKDLSKLADKTIKFLNNNIFRSRMKKRVKIAKEKLSWDNQIISLISYYKCL